MAVLGAKAQAPRGWQLALTRRVRAAMKICRRKHHVNGTLWQQYSTHPACIQHASSMHVACSRPTLLYLLADYSMNQAVLFTYSM